MNLSLLHSRLLLTITITVIMGWFFFPGCTTNEGHLTKPNIIVILADDMGYGDVTSYNPRSRIPTPNVDRLAAEGLHFTDAHSPSAVCTPTRYGLLTGRYAWRTTLKRGVTQGYSPNLIATTRMTLASMLKQAGYTTGGFGKWHLGLGADEETDYEKPLRPGPVSLGFDRYYGIPASLDMPPYLYFENDRVVINPTENIANSGRCCVGPFWRGGPIAPGFRHIDVLPVITTKAVGFIEQHVRQSPERPFFLYFPLAAPHTPHVPTEPFQDQSGAGAYGDFTMQVDATVGQIMGTLDRLGLRDNTLLIFTSDNGAYWLARHIEQYDHRANLDLRGMKADIWEGGHRVPFVARWPARINAGTTSDELLSLTDLMATFAAVVGSELPPETGEDSYNMLPVLLGIQGDEPIRDTAVFHSYEGIFAIRQGPWKLIKGRGSGGFSEPRHIEPGPGKAVGQLYNLTEDPGETVNLYQQRPTIVGRLDALLELYKEQGFSRPME